MAKSNFIVRGGADFSGISREMNKTEKQFKGFEGRINKAFSGITSGMGLNLGKLSKFALIGAGIKKLYDFGKASIEVASDLREVQNVVDVTFGSMSNQVNEFASNATKQFGLSELSAKKYTSTMGAMLKSSGITGQTVTDMSIEVAKLTADMASFYNLEGDEAFTKIRSGLSGQTEPLKQLGINMSVANMQAYALSQGIRKKWQEMSQAEQTMLRYNYLLSVTADAQGDFARESGTWANQVKLLKEQWQEFMGLMGQAFIKVLLPVVKLLNRLLEAVINVVKGIGQLYTLITGKEVNVESNVTGAEDLTDGYNNIADSSVDAGKGQGKLADGVKKAAKEAKKALAPFDELNILQKNLGSNSGGSGGSGSGIVPGLSSGGMSGINTKMSTKAVDDGPDRSRWEDFFAWFGNKWNGLKQMLAVPVMVPAPVFAAIPVPVYQPEWGLIPPPVQSPVFNPIPNPVYRPNWNLTPPLVPQIAFPPIIYTAYNQSLQTIKNLMTQTKTSLEHSYGQLRENLTTQTSIMGRNIQQGLSTAWSTVEGNLRTHRTNVGVIATGIGSVLAVNIGRGLSTMGRNVNNAITTVQNNLNTFGRGAASAAAEIGRSFSYNVSQGFNTAVRNFSNFVRGMGTNLRSFGSGMLSGALQTARGFVSNLVSGFQTVWNNFRNLMSNMGERVGGWFSANRSVIGKVAIGVGVGAAVAGIAIAAPQMIPFAAKALGGLAAIPALAQGGYVGANNPQLAIIGDNRREGEIVAPESKIYQQTLKAIQDAGGGGQVIEIHFGSNVYRTIINEINKENRRAGRTVINL